MPAGGGPFQVSFAVYFGYYGFEASTIIHETLHSFTGLDDDALDKKVGGNLSVELEKHGCG